MKSTPGHEVADIDQLQGHAQVRAVRAEAAHRLGIGQTREGIRQLDTLHVAEERADHGLHDRHQLVLGHEGDLDVELGELGLTIGAQILVPEAAGDLIVAVHAGHHEQLLEELRRLRQRKELARMGTAGHQIVARALGRGLGQDRGLDIQKTLRIQEIAHRLGHPAAGA